MTISIRDSAGKFVHAKEIKKSELSSGKNYIKLDNVNIGYGAYWYTVEIGNKKMTRKVIWTE